MKILMIFAALIVPLYGAVATGNGGQTTDTDDIRDYGWSVSGFSTDFSRMIVDPVEIISGGPPKDGIPAVDEPKYESQESADSWLSDKEPVILLRIGEEARIYPLQILTWHEIVNDSLNNVPLIVSFCPLCNTGVVFRRDYNGQILDFGTTGQLRNSNLIMYDRQTESWWQQATGEALAGEFTGGVLDFIPALTLSYSEAREVSPEADVLSRNTGYSRPYGRNPYQGYDTQGNRPFLFQGPVDPAADAMDRVLLIKHRGEDSVVFYSDVMNRGIAQLEVGGELVVVFHATGAVSALDSAVIANGRVVGSLNAFLPRVGDRPLEFRRVRPDVYTDIQTGSLWNSSGISTSGELAGETLKAVTGIQHFWFSAMAF